ncbi:MAG: hypothetical protein A3K68_02395 [Euryarchaeota archaeon RBG_16_68_13]|nr:MAG: hypothetical protein A3K68_02395 [Euryarchaeota archaeon RBG_16_68_13]
MERIRALFDLAEAEARRKDGTRARRYVGLARRIGTRYNVRMPANLKRRFCKDCGAYLLPSVNARIRVGRGRLIVTCLGCGGIQRMPFVRERSRRRARRPNG